MGGQFGGRIAGSGYGVGGDRKGLASMSFESVAVTVSNLGGGAPTGAASEEKRCSQGLRDRGKGERGGARSAGLMVECREICSGWLPGAYVSGQRV